MNYIVLDLEWNQSPHGKEYEREELPFEVIEIGAVKLNENLEIIDSFGEIIRPTVYREMHRICKEITGISSRDLKKGRYFTQVFPEFLAWCGVDYMFCTWGSGDLVELQRNMQYYKIENYFPFPLYFYDVQKLFSLSCEDGKSRRNLKYAVEFLQNAELEKYHRAKADAIYTAEVIRNIDFAKVKDKVSVDCFRVPQSKMEEVHLVFDTYCKDISQPYDSKEALMRDRRMQMVRCYKCKKNAKRKIRWFSDGARACYSVSYCNEHGWLKGKIRIRKTTDGRYYGIRTLKLIDRKEADLIKEKQEQLREKRKLRRHKGSKQETGF